jgi:hypothetical protein
MKRKGIYLLLICCSLSLFACTRESKEKPEVLAKINDFDLTVDAFQSQLASELEMDKDFKLTREAKQAFLNELIKKEIFIQEARRLKLDTKEAFRRAIERYWESTLIRDLLEMKGREIAGKTYVTEEEIQSRYNAMKASDRTLPPLGEMREEITRKLKEEKKSKLLEAWINRLKQKAKIKIDERLL